MAAVNLRCLISRKTVGRTLFRGLSSLRLQTFRMRNILRKCTEMYIIRASGWQPDQCGTMDN